jgi:hypothetical protein
MALSNRQIRELGDRLRDSDSPSPDDLVLLAEVLTRYNDALDQVTLGLRSIGLDPTTRLKTSGTIIDKLRRQPHLDLRTIRDLAGARVVQPMTLDRQDEISGAIRQLWPNAQVIDRRSSPSHGYRAVHLVPKIDGRAVEIQVRTMFQDTWAQLMESIGDAWGREVRYGGEPEDPAHPVTSDAETTRGQLVEAWKAQSELLHQLAVNENELARLRTEAGWLAKRRIDKQVEEMNAQVREYRIVILNYCDALRAGRDQ